MVHKIYFYDSHVGTGRVLEFAFLKDDEDSFKEALYDFKFSFRYTLNDCHFMVLSPDDVCDEPYTNIVVDCSESVLMYLIEFAEVFFRIRGFRG